MKDPIVSIIVTTKNEEGNINRLLKSLKDQTYDHVEIVVVDNNSDDNTVKLSKKYSDKVYNFGPERSAQRNFGTKKAIGKYVLILDADMELSKGVVAECVQLCEKDKNVGGVVIPEESIAVRFWEKVKAYERSFYNLEGDVLTDSARFFPKKVFWEVGGYDETITGPEDWDLPDSIRSKGYTIARINALIFHYERIPSLLKLINKKYYYALKSHRYLKKQKINVFSPKTIYFLRPVFYRQWKKILLNPIMSVAMFFMLGLELLAGSLGYLYGRIEYK